MTVLQTCVEADSGINESACQTVPQAIILLAGGAGLHTFSAVIGRSVLELPIAPGVTLLSLWQDQLRVLSAPNHGAMPLKVVGGPDLTAMASRVSGLEHVADPQELRGTGGVLRDVTGTDAEDSYVIVSSAASVLLRPLQELVNDLLADGGDVSVFVHDDSSSSSLIAVRCGCLRQIAPIGFVDLKEQALPQIARTGNVHAIRRPRAVTASVRTPALSSTVGSEAWNSRDLKSRPH